MEDSDPEYFEPGLFSPVKRKRVLRLSDDEEDEPMCTHSDDSGKAGSISASLGQNGLTTPDTSASLPLRRKSQHATAAEAIRSGHERDSTPVAEREPKAYQRSRATKLPSTRAGVEQKAREADSEPESEDAFQPSHSRRRRLAKRSVKRDSPLTSDEEPYNLRTRTKQQASQPQGNFRRLVELRQLTSQDAAENRQDESDGSSHSTQADSDTDDDSLGDFIVEGDAHDDAEARELARDAGILNIGGIEEIFGDYVVILAKRLLLPPDKIRDTEEAEALAICKKVELRLADNREKCVKSQSWNDAVKGFIPALRNRPYSRLRELQEDDLACAACTRAKSHASRVIVFSGSAYEPEWVTGEPLKEAADQGKRRGAWLQDSRCKDPDYGEEDDASDCNESFDDASTSPASRKSCKLAREEGFAVGNWCAARVRLFHSLLHFKRHLQELIADKLHLLLEDVHLGPNQEGEHASGDSEEFRAENQAIDRLASDQTFIEEQHDHFQQLIDMAVSYLNDSRSNQNAWKERSGGMASKVHDKLDDLTSGASVVARNMRLVADGSGNLTLARPANSPEPSIQLRGGRARFQNLSESSEGVLGGRGRGQLPKYAGTKANDALKARTPTASTPRREGEAGTPRLRQSTLNMTLRPRQTLAPAGRESSRFRQPNFALHSPSSKQKEASDLSPDDISHAEPDDSDAAADSSSSRSQECASLDHQASEAPSASAIEDQLPAPSPAREIALTLDDIPAVAAPSSIAVQNITRLHLALGSALQAYQSDAHARQGGQLSVTGWNSRHTASTLVHQLQQELGFKSVAHGRLAVHGLAELFMQLSGALNKFVEARADAPPNEREEAQKACLMSLEAIRSRL